MPRVFVYEHLTACGIGRDPASPDHGMYREGRAMRDAIAADLRAIPGTDVTLADGFQARRLEAAFRQTVRGYDLALLIAPEPDLASLRGWTDQAGVPCAGSTVEAIELTGCKIDLARHWQDAGVPTPPAVPAADWFREPTPFPVVVKPVYGAGSTATFRVDAAEQLPPTLELAGEIEPDLLVQPFVPGRPASVAFLIGPGQVIPLCPTFQRLSDYGRFQYLGGQLPIPPTLAERAVVLGRRAVACVPGLAGYVGVDLILGDEDDGSGDYAIEINPRLTTSYVGLQKLADFNIAGAMLDVIAGRPVGELRWQPLRVRFRVDGSVEYAPAPTPPPGGPPFSGK
jgi:predicted ATP-grasp superfamily ATP-dependent carboligase